jgi:hypothetical protein
MITLLAQVKGTAKSVCCGLLITAMPAAYASPSFTTEIDNQGPREAVEFYRGLAGGQPATLGPGAGLGQTSISDAAQGANSVANIEAEIAKDLAVAMNQKVRMDMAALERRLAQSAAENEQTFSWDQFQAAGNEWCSKVSNGSMTTMWWRGWQHYDVRCR